MRLKVVTGTPAPDSPTERVRKRLRATKGPLLQCHRCGSREVLQTKVGVEIVDGKPRGGTKALVCASCWLKGERVVLA
jgi:hypothetical protein